MSVGKQPYIFERREKMIFWNKKKRKKRKTSSQKPIIQPSKKSSTLERKPYTPPQRKSPENHSTKNIDIPPKKTKNFSSKFVKSPPDPNKEFLNTFEKLTSERHRPWDIWKDFIIITACTISNAVDKSHYKEREKRYLSIIKKYNKNEQEIFPELLADTVMALEENPEQDFLGEMYMILELGYGKLQQMFTPYHVCRLMSSITIGNIAKQVEEQGYITLNDSCCGAGATLIAGIHEIRKKLEKERLNFQNHVLVSGQDIEEVVALMCYIQLSLLGVAAYIKVGNSLTEPMSENDSTENYWFTPIYFSDVWTMRRTIKKFNQIMKGEESKK